MSCEIRSLRLEIQNLKAVVASMQTLLQKQSEALLVASSSTCQPSASFDVDCSENEDMCLASDGPDAVQLCSHSSNSAIVQPTTAPETNVDSLHSPDQHSAQGEGTEDLRQISLDPQYSRLSHAGQTSSGSMLQLRSCLVSLLRCHQAPRSCDQMRLLSRLSTQRFPTAAASFKFLIRPLGLTFCLTTRRHIVI